MADDPAQAAGVPAAFADFDIAAVAAFGDADRDRLMADAGIVRNRLKVEAALANARAALPRDRGARLPGGVPLALPPGGARCATPYARTGCPSSPESKAMAKELKKRGFRFVGPTTAYSLMQAAGIVNDHAAGCCVHGAVETEQLAAAARFA